MRTLAPLPSTTLSHTIKQERLDGCVTRVGSGQHPQYTRADFGPEAVGSSVHKCNDQRAHHSLRDTTVAQKKNIYIKAIQKKRKMKKKKTKQKN